MKRTIRSSSEIDGLFRTGAKAANDHMLVISGPQRDERGPQGRVAFVAGKKLGGAVARNRAKRRLRASAQHLGGPWPGRDVVLVARPGIADAGPGELDAALERALHQLGVVER
jgi:ribonuclease P protein component